MRHYRWAALIATGLALAALPVLARTMYARLSTPVRSGQGLAAQTVGTLKQGQAVEVLGREGSYYRVSHAGQTGWVYFNKLAEDKPEDMSVLLTGGGLGGGIKLTELQTGGALRGLSPMAEDYAAARNVPQWAVQAVEEMQARTIDAEQLEEFQQEGGLGEYGEEVAR